MTDVWTRLDPSRAQALCRAWTGRRVAVVGDVMVDRYLWGNVSRISPEAPVPVVDVERESTRFGGAANVARNIHVLGGVPRLLGVTGDDAQGENLRQVLADAGLDIAGLVADPSRPTTRKTRIIARGQHVVRADQESREEVAGEVAAALARAIRSNLDAVDAVIISDYGKGVITGDLLAMLLRETRSRGIPVCVDPKDTHFFSYQGVDVITPNQFEAAEVLGYKLRDEPAVGRAGEEILSRLESRAVLITRGEKGMSLFEAGGRRTDFPTVAQKVFDVTGAGDTVVSCYALALSAGAEPREAAILSNHAAGLVVAKVGTAAPDPAALVASFAEAP